MTAKYNRRNVEVISVSTPATVILPMKECKSFLRVGDDDDALLTMLINVAVDGAEKFLRRAIRTQTIELTMDGFPFSDDESLVRLGGGTHQVPPSYILGDATGIDLPYAPVNSITSITTYNRANVGTVFSASAYMLDGARITLNDGYTWPTDLRERAAVKIRYVAGYGPNALPPSIKIAMMQHMTAMYECRGGCELPIAARNMMQAYQIKDGLTW